MIKAFAVLCCLLGLLFLRGAWNMVVSTHEPEVDQRPVPWFEILIELFTNFGGIQPTAVDRFTAVVAFLVFGLLFLVGGLYIGLD